MGDYIIREFGRIETINNRRTSLLMTQISTNLTNPSSLTKQLDVRSIQMRLFQQPMEEIMMIITATQYVQITKCIHLPIRRLRS